MKAQRAFTLIELLCVVAIIAVLAALAIANFSEAQERSKHVRVISDLRIVGSALEVYAVDNGRYPKSRPAFSLSVELLPFELTSPVSYLPRLPDEPFPEGGVYGIPTYKYFEWQESSQEHEQRRSWYGRWMTASNGPDQRWNGGAFPYDPTNGVRSDGDIVWRQSEHARRNR